MTAPRQISVGNLTIANDKPLTILAGPCAMESRDHALDMAGALKEISDDLGIGLIYKSSYDKANRTSVSSGRGIGLDKAMDIFQEIKKTTGLPTVTDVHTAEHCDAAANGVDVLQIPAFLCRQTDLLLAAGNTGKAINVKKGQFLAPWDMANVAKKVESTGNMNVMLCERGASFGYNTLVSDMRALPEMAKTSCPIVFDATHSVQQPGGQGNTTGGDRRMAPVLARAAVSVGVAAVFMETHQDPDSAPSDGPNMIRLDQIKGVIEMLMKFDDIAKANPVEI
jgi:2-dehydro-3-deoxyphosphooctonate aldolase (KDO 8-P synthase)